MDQQAMTSPENLTEEERRDWDLLKRRPDWYFTNENCLDLLTTIDSLRTENAGLKKGLEDAVNLVLKRNDEISDLRAENAALREAKEVAENRARELGNVGIVGALMTENAALRQRLDEGVRCFAVVDKDGKPVECHPAKEAAEWSLPHIDDAWPGDGPHTLSPGRFIADKGGEE